MEVKIIADSAFFKRKKGGCTHKAKLTINFKPILLYFASLKKKSAGAV